MKKDILVIVLNSLEMLIVVVVEKVLVDEEYWETVKKNGAPSQPLTNSQVKKQAQKPVEKSQSTLG